jgi:hypothetical protein
MNFQGQPLFVDTSIQMEKVGRKLTKDANGWESQVMDQLHAEHPYILDYPIKVRIKKSDEETGHGIGAVKIADKVAIPIIIESNQLQPLDIFMDGEGQIHSMTRLTLEEALQSRDTGKLIKPNETGASSDSALGHMVLPPYDGKYAFASVMEADRGTLTSWFDDLEYLVEKNASLHNVLRQLAAPKMVKQASVRSVELFNKTKDAQKITQSGLYKVATDKGLLTGIVSTRNVSMTTGQFLQDVNAFLGLGKEGGYASSRSSMLGTISSDGKVETSPEQGRGVYVLYKAGEFTATEPVTLTADVNVDNDTLWARTDAGHTRRIEKLASIDNDIVSAGETVYLSKDWKFIPIGSTVKLAETQVVSRQGDIVDLQRVGDLVRLSSPELLGLNKLASNEGVTVSELSEVLSDRMEAGQVVQTLQKLASSKSATLLVEKEALGDDMSSLPVPHISNEERGALLKVAAYITPALLKEAKINAEYTERTIDAILGLNFLSPENLHKFLDAIPVLEEAQQVVAKLLLSSRLGLPIESRPLRSAMYALDAVSRDLRELRNQTMVR